MVLEEAPVPFNPDLVRHLFRLVYPECRTILLHSGTLTRQLDRDILVIQVLMVITALEVMGASAGMAERGSGVATEAVTVDITRWEVTEEQVLDPAMTTGTFSSFN